MLRALPSGWTEGSPAAGIAGRTLAGAEAAGMYGSRLREGAERDSAEPSARYAELGAHVLG
ncbi:hypothetical protein ACFVFI_05200 [Streptomyces sp. NPDC057705]|uniref:hypothetical protein n=1 Tax=Streptomyces sp. NPDC057705 TaxID=3346222 RepID=UPI0036D048A2